MFHVCGGVRITRLQDVCHCYAEYRELFLVRIEFYWVCFRLGLFLRQFLDQVGLKLHIQWRVTLNF